MCDRRIYRESTDRSAWCLWLLVEWLVGRIRVLSSGHSSPAHRDCGGGGGDAVTLFFASKRKKLHWTARSFFLLSEYGLDRILLCIVVYYCVLLCTVVFVSWLIFVVQGHFNFQVDMLDIFSLCVSSPFAVNILFE